jgi:hypothetical protein
MVHPTDPNTLYAGDVWLNRSTDGGMTFQRLASQIHVDQHFLTFDPQNPQAIYVGNDGGVYGSSDGGNTWGSHNTNLALTQFYTGVSLHPTQATTAIGGTQDNGTLLYEGSTFWPRVIGGDGGHTAIDFLSPTTRYGEIQWNTGVSGPRRSDALGSYFLKNAGVDLADRAAFLPPLVMDPQNPHRLYFGTYRLYRTEDCDESWVAISDDLTDGRVVASIAPARSDPTTIYVGTLGRSPAGLNGRRGDLDSAHHGAPQSGHA